MIINIKELITYKNKTTNGETQFENISKKFLPDANGILLDGDLANVEQNIDITYSFPGNYRLPLGYKDLINLDTEHTVENFNNLRAVVWIENAQDKLVLNATETTETITGINEISVVDLFKVTPNPARSIATLEIKLKEPLNGTLSISDMQGNLLWNSNQSLSSGTTSIELPIINTLSTGNYIVMFKAGKKIAVQELSIVK
jgi:hypothetical protein